MIVTTSPIIEITREHTEYMNVIFVLLSVCFQSSLRSSLSPVPLTSLSQFRIYYANLDGRFFK